MFTGIIEEVGELVDLRHGQESAVLRIRGPLVTSDAEHGDSICVNGVCLTVTGLTDGCFTVDVMAESLARSNLGSLAPGSPVNLERALAATGRFGGHIVQGHVDGTGVIRSRIPGEAWETVEVELPATLSKYLVEKGSVTIDGVSLTVVEVRPNAFTVSLIPTTLTQTTLGTLQVGAAVNLEVDVIGKYVASYLARTGAGWPAPDEQEGNEDE